MKNLVIMLFVGVLLGPGSGAAAQEVPIPPAGGADYGPPQLGLPSMPAPFGSGTRSSELPETLPGMELPATSRGSVGAPLSDSIPEPISAGDFQPSFQPLASDNEYAVLDCQPALLESTGTWLRRGFWYTEIDALLMDRIWRRDNFVLALQDNSATGGFGALNQLLVEGGRTGAEVTPRLNVGRFLFRDHKNRDHAMEFIAFGGSQWTDSGRLDATAGGSLEVGSYNIIESDVGFNTVRLPLDLGNPSFDGASSMQFDYDSRFNNFELNYHIKSRMQKDRMELEPSGDWVRRAQPSVSRTLMAGIRYFNLSEDFDWDAFGINDPATAAVESETGTYRVRTDNDLIGTQLGYGWTYETARWSLGLQNKNGIYINSTDVESNFEITGGGAAGNNKISVDNLSFIMEASLVGKWHLRPNFSLRAGLEMLFVTSVAHASEQLNFIPVSTSQVVAGGDSTYMGGLIGFEGYW